MPPFIALSICFVFICWLLRLDRACTRNLSPWLWVPTTWMLVAATRPIASWFTPDEYAVGGSIAEGSARDRAVLLTLIVLGLIVLIKRGFNWSRLATEYRAITVLFLFMLISIAWSDFPFVSFKRWIKTAGTLLMALVVLSENHPRESLQAILRRVAYVLIPLSATLIKYRPDLGVSFHRWTGTTMWCGATMTKNTLGALCMISLFYLIWNHVRRREGKGPPTPKYQRSSELIVFMMGLWMLRGPGGVYSATSVAVLMMGIATFFFLRRSKTISLHAVSITVLLGIGAFTVILQYGFDTTPVGLVADIFGRDATLTGRTDMIWNKLIPIIKESPIIGQGYGSFWIVPIFEFAINQAHNGYLDVLIELGFIGLIMLVFVLISYYRKSAAEYLWDKDWGAFRIALLLIIIVHNVTETSFLRSTILLWNTLVFFMVVHSPKGNGAVSDSHGGEHTSAGA